MSPATGAPCLACRARHDWSLSPGTPGLAKPKAWYCRHEDNGAAGGWLYSSLPFSRKGCVVGRKVVNTDALCFPKPAFLANSCVYKTLEERVRKDSVLRMTSFYHLVCFRLHHCRQEGAGGKLQGLVDWTYMVSRHAECLCVCAFIRDIISLFSAPLPPLIPRASNTFSRMLFSPRSAPSEEGWIGRLMFTPNHFNKLPTPSPTERKA